MKASDDLEDNFQENMDFLGDFYHDDVMEEPADLVMRSSLLGLSKAQDEKYQVLGRLDSGGMKIICQVVDRDTTRHLAMALPREEARTSDDLEKFIREARITALLEHPNIVPIHDIGINGADLPYFTMKMIEGENLGDVLEHYDSLTPGSEDTLECFIEIFLKICDAIAFAHSKGVLHLDLKPANIHLSDYGDVQVIDWGLARFFNAEGIVEEVVDTNSRLIQRMSESFNHTVNGLIQGTPSYMAPEQALGHNELRNVQTDVYALGAILYSLLTYKKPISDEDYKRVLEKTINGEFPKPSKSNPANNIPLALESICLKAMKLKAKDRYATVDHLIAEIRAWREGYAPKAQNAPIWLHLKLFIKRNKFMVGLIMMSLMTITGILMVSFLRLRQSEGLARQNELKALEALSSLQLSEKKNEDTLKELMESENETQTALVHLGKVEQEKAKLSEIAIKQLRARVRQSVNDLSFHDLDDDFKQLQEYDAWDREMKALSARLALGRLEFTKARELCEEIKDKASLALMKKLELEKINLSTMNLKDVDKVLTMINKFGFKEWMIPLVYQSLNKTSLSTQDRLELINRANPLNEKKRKTFSLKQNDDKTWRLVCSASSDIRFAAFALLPIKSISWIRKKKKSGFLENYLDRCLKIMGGFKTLEDLDLTGHSLKGLYAMKNMKLKTLNLSSGSVPTLGHLVKCDMVNTLETLDIRVCKIVKFDGLLSLKKLKELKIDKDSKILTNKGLLKKFKKKQVKLIQE